MNTNITLFVALMVLLLVGCLYAFAHRRRDLIACNANYGTQLRHTSLTRKLESAVAQRYLNATYGALAFGADICGLADRPIGFFNDEGGVGDAIAIERGTDKTAFGIAAVAIAIGDELYTAANGKTSNVAASTSWFRGVAITAVSAPDAALGGDSAIVEYDPACAQEAATA